MSWMVVEMVEKLCPRCGGKYSYIEHKKVGKRVYAYAVHTVRGKRLRCYLGAEDGYVYVTKTHSDLGLQLLGMNREDRVLIYLQQLIDYVEVNLADDSKRYRVLSLLKEALEVLESGPEVEF